jgi:predicted metal-binding membrane protein
MPLPFTPDAFFDVFAAYNQRLWPFALALWLLTAYALVVLTRARPVRPWFIPGLLAIHWAWAGLAYHAAFFSRINPAAWVFSGLFLLEAGLLLWHGVIHPRLQVLRGPFFRHFLSWGLIAYALLYPAIARAEGTRSRGCRHSEFRAQRRS